MNKGEKALFKALCSFKAEKFDPDLLYYATPEVLGTLFINRMQGVAYGVLKKSGRFDGVSREFVNSLKLAAEENAERNRSYFKAVEYLTELVKESGCKAAFLKGAVLCAKYPEGYRTSNDVDLLVSPEDVTKLGKVLFENGFGQGYVKNGEFVAATRKEIISSKLNRGEVVPYIKEVSLPKLRYLEVDLNFSLDCRPDGGVALNKMLSARNGVFLAEDDFFIHLCLHLYKEATNLPWIKMKRDMTFYKYCDIYAFLCEMSDEKFYDVILRAKTLGVENETAFAVAQTEALFGLKKRSAEVDMDFVYSPSDSKTFGYAVSDVEKRFFAENRLSLLREV